MRTIDKADEVSEVYSALKSRSGSGMWSTESNAIFMLASVMLVGIASIERGIEQLAIEAKKQNGTW